MASALTAGAGLEEEAPILTCHRGKHSSEELLSILKAGLTPVGVHNNISYLKLQTRDQELILDQSLQGIQSPVETINTR